jgi:ATPase subunit of ABC transporter with duplicated ATPase domains
MTSLSWNQFRTKNKGKGYTLAQLSKMYKKASKKGSKKASKKGSKKTVKKMKLIDVEKRNKEYSTFEIIPRNELENLVGSFVKVMKSDERFWVRIIKQNPDGSFNATIQNKLLTHKYPVGTTIKIKKNNIIDLE